MKNKIINLYRTVTYPLDLTKTRLQIQGEKSLTEYNVAEKKNVVNINKRGMIKTAAGIGESGFELLLIVISRAQFN